MELRLLGPLEIRVEGALVPLSGAKQRTLIALLAIGDGEPVPVERIADELWAEPPASAAQSVQMHVSRLRRVLPEAIITYPTGYALESADVDAHRFERLLADAREAGDAARRRTLLAEALELWRGDPLGGVALGPALSAEAVRLGERRLSAQLARIECDLVLGRAAEVIGELEALAAREPFSERVRSLLMLALYREGRQADALDVFRRTRELLVEELGLEPSPALQELQQRILRHDPELNGEPASRTVASAPVRRPSRRPVASVAFAAALVAAAALAIAGFAGKDPGRLESDAVGLLDPETGELTRRLNTTGRIVGMAATADAVWLADADAGALVRLDPKDLQAVDTIPIGAGTTAVAAGEGAVWALSSDTRRLAQVNTITNTVVRRLRVGNGARALVVAAGAVWVVNALDGTVSVFDVASGRAIAELPVGAGPRAVAAGAGAVWVANDAEGTVTRLDARARAPVATVRVGGGPSGLAVTRAGVWVVNSGDGTASLIDPQRNVVTATVSAGRGAETIAAAAGRVWIGAADVLTAIDPATGAATRRFGLGATPAALAVSTEGLWTAARVPRSGGTVLMTGGDEHLSLDPAIAYSDRSWPLLAVVADGLVGHRRAAGAAGAGLVPDLARGLPEPTNGGLTYRFQLRPGLRYSTGAPVRARDVRASIERLHRMNAFALGSFPLGLRGERRCGPQRCDLSDAIATNDETGTFTFHLARPNPDFLLNLATPTYAVLPAGTPARDLTGPELIGTGPYRIAAGAPGRTITLARNPRFVPWSNAAQPVGSPDRIVWRPGGGPDADIAMDVAAEEVERLSVRAPNRVRTQPTSILEYVWLNTRTPPFDRPDARRAVAYAADPAALTRNLPAAARLTRRPTCRLLAPGFPGYDPRCPIARPDLERARGLVRRSGTEGATVTFYAPSDNPGARAVGRSFVRLLRRIGYRARLNLRFAMRDQRRAYAPWTLDPAHHAQAGWALWISDTPVASNVIPPLLSCRARRVRGSGLAYNQAQFCARALERLMARAHELEAADPAAANRLWSRLDRTLIEQAPIIPLFSQRNVQITSARLANYQFHVRLGPLLAHAHVR